jgi:hypothetical protein
MKSLRIEFSTPIRVLGLAAAIALGPLGASADSFYLVSETGTFAANAPTTTESAPNATFSYSFLIDSTPAINFVTNFTGADCGFDAPISDFKYTLNGAPVALTFPDVEFFGSSFGGGAGITPSAPEPTTPTSTFAADNFFLYTQTNEQFYSGTFENPTIIPGIYQLDPNQSIFETDYMGTNATAISGDIEITATPEPSSLVLLITGLAGLAIAVRRKLCTSSLRPSPLP